MEVTKSNFNELRPEIEEAIGSCSFLAVDGEFTGLNNGPNNISPFDTPAEYYSKIHSGSMDFLFVQFGLSVFKHISDFKYENKTYVFYLFPEPMNRDAPDRRFLCQSSSLTFLAKHGFDFNKLIRDGIPYLKECDESTLRETIDAKKKMWAANMASPQSHVDIPPAQKPLVDDVISQIKELLSPNCDKEVVRVEKCSAFTRKLVYQTVREELSNSGITVETEKGVLVARKAVDKSQLEEEKKKKADEEEKEIQDAVGFVSIIKMLINSGKLMVGHNFLLDLCHTVHQFVDCLPLDYLEFKNLVNTLFPKIIDTKFLCSEGPLKDLFPSTTVPSLLETVFKPPFQLPEIVHEENRSYELGVDKYHDAGYDAFVTGVCFLSGLRYLESKGEKVHNVNNSSLLSKVINRLFLMRIPDTCMNLGGKDPEPPRHHVFHVTFPKTWTIQRLNELFSDFGSIHISWISDETAWVALQDRQQSGRAKAFFQTKYSKLANSVLPGVAVVPYHKYRASTAQAPPNKPPTTQVTSTTTERKRKMSPEANQWQTVEASQNKKTRSSASNNSQTKEETNGKGEGIAKLESAATESSSQTFPVNDNWD